MELTSPVSDSSWSKISEDPFKMWTFTNENLTDYFVFSNEKDGLEKQDWKSLNAGGYKLFAEGHVQDIYVCTKTEECLVKASCLPEMKKDTTYLLSIILEKSGKVKEASCKCPAGRGPRGSCKHIAAFCYSLADFVKTREIALELGEDACTSMLQKWNQPSRKRKLDPEKAEDISFNCPVPPHLEKAKKRRENKGYDPRPLAMQKTTAGDLEELCSSLEQLPTVRSFLHLLRKPTLVRDDSSDDAVSALPLIPKSVQCRIKDKLVKMPLPPALATLEDFGEEFIELLTPTEEQKTQVEKKTRLQAECQRWHEERYCRLTASRFGSVINRRSAHTVLAKKIADGQKIPETVRAIKWGRDHEAVAFEQYCLQMSDRHPRLKLQKSGFVIGEPSFLGASPDGVLVDESGKIQGIIEIKCPYSAAGLTVKDACKQCKGFYCALNDDGLVTLDSGHAYYYQILGTMAITKATFCDFIIWTSKSMEIINVRFDEGKWSSTLAELTKFYKQYMLPYILY